MDAHQQDRRQEIQTPLQDSCNLPPEQGVAISKRKELQFQNSKKLIQQWKFLIRCLNLPPEQRVTISKEQKINSDLQWKFLIRILENTSG